MTHIRLVDQKEAIAFWSCYKANTDLDTANTDPDHWERWAFARFVPLRQVFPKSLESACLLAKEPDLDVSISAQIDLKGFASEEVRVIGLYFNYSLRGKENNIRRLVDTILDPYHRERGYTINDLVITKL